MSNELELIRSTLEVFGPASAAGATVRALCAALEKHLDARYQRPAGDAEGLRLEIDDNLTTTMLVWADAVADDGNARAADGIRWLARQGKRPGSVAGRFRWSAEKPEFGTGASWTLPEQLVRAINANSPDGRGRFATLSSALLLAAELVPGYLAWAATQKKET